MRKLSRARMLVTGAGGCTESHVCKRLFASNQRTRQRLHWVPEINLRNGLEQTVRWFRGRRDLSQSHLYHV